jgi:hypothetical protein
MLGSRKTKEMIEERMLDEETVDQAIRDALGKYAKDGLILDSLFWAQCLRLLQKKYHFKLAGKS